MLIDSMHSGPLKGQLQFCLKVLAPKLSKRSLSTNLKLWNKHSNEPKFDEAHIFAPRLTEAEYKPKRDRKFDFEWSTQSEDSLTRQTQDRMEKMAKLTAALQGLLILGGIGGATIFYFQWPSVKAWWTKIWLTHEQKLSDEQKKNSVKKSSAVPVMPPSQLDSNIPGLYYWGLTGADKKAWLYPRRLPHFNNMSLRDVCFTDKSSNLAIDESGNLLEWDIKNVKTILPNQKLIKIKYSNGLAYALNELGEILIIPLQDKDLRNSHITKSKNWLKLWNDDIKYNWKLNTKDVFTSTRESRVVDFDTGAKHLVLISNVGKAYSCSTGIETTTEFSRGQLGLPQFSLRGPLPPSNKLFEIELLNKSLDKSKRLNLRTIEKVVCGSYHTLAQDSTGSVFAFGSNKYGQLGLPVTFGNDAISFPKQIDQLQAYFKRNEIYKCVDINCTNEASFLTISSHNLDNGLANVESNIRYFGFGNSLNGTVGNCTYKNSQTEPSPLKELIDRKIPVESWFCGAEHVSCKLKNGEVLTWGNNCNGQLSNGKNFKTNRPQNIPALLNAGESITYDSFLKTKLKINEQQTICNGSNSACLYWKAK